MAIKIESHQSPVASLLYEARVLADLQGLPGFPKLYWAGTDGDYNVMVLSLLGPTLYDLYVHCGQNHFTLQTVCMVAVQCFSLLQRMHDRGFLHRDIKPMNMAMGTGNNQDTVFMIDFGLAKKYIDERTG